MKGGGKMPSRAAQYRNTANRIAFSMLIFLVLSIVHGYVLALVSILFSGMPEPWFSVMYELVHGALYVVCFLLPVSFFRLASRGKRVEPIRYEPRVGPDLPLYLLIGIALISSAAVDNAELVSLIDVFGFFGASSGGATLATPGYLLVLQFFTAAVVPAFVEELLFRGVFLSNLLPFGKTGAIFVSALVFGLMHQSLTQLFYATVAGLILGFLYVKAGSIWPCVLVHFTNNFYSLLRQVIYERLDAATATGIILAIQGALFAGAILSVFLLCRRADAKVRAADEATHLEPVGLEIPPLRQLKLCFTPWLIAFVIVSVACAFAYLLL
jgi:membrane protease YdiL (CAAX protease family)